VQGDEYPPEKIFVTPGKMRWTQFKTIGYSLRNLGPSQKTFRSPAVPSWLRAWFLDMTNKLPIYEALTVTFV